jgi:hypothetical protein
MHVKKSQVVADQLADLSSRFGARETADPDL